jgi:Flagellar hook-length control protein FliK
MITAMPPLPLPLLLSLPPLPVVPTAAVFADLLGAGEGVEEPTREDEASPIVEPEPAQWLPALFGGAPCPIAVPACPKPDIAPSAAGFGEDASPLAVKKPGDQPPVITPALAAPNPLVAPQHADQGIEISPPDLPQPERHLNLAKEDLWLGQLARDIVEAGQGDQLAFRLSPPHLGKLDVSISTRSEGIAIEFRAGKSEVRDILTDAKSHLVDHIQAQGVRVIDAHIAPGGQNLADQHRPSAKFIPLVEAEIPKSKLVPIRTQRRKRGRFA